MEILEIDSNLYHKDLIWKVDNLTNKLKAILWVWFYGLEFQVFVSLNYAYNMQFATSALVFHFWDNRPNENNSREDIFELVVPEVSIHGQLTPVCIMEHHGKGV